MAGIATTLTEVPLAAVSSATVSSAASIAWLLRQRGLEVRLARARMIAARDSAPRHWDSHAARQELLTALERLQEVSVRVGVPLSYRLHAELELYRGLSWRS